MLLPLLVCFDAAALDYRLQFDANCSAPATVVRDYRLSFAIPREVVFLGEEETLRLGGGMVRDDPLFVDAQQIGRFSAADPALAVQAGSFGVARITAATAALCQPPAWFARFDYVFGQGAGNTVTVTVDMGDQTKLAITDAGKRRFAARLASSRNDIFKALLGPEQAWIRDLLASGMDSDAIERFRVTYCLACTRDDVRKFAQKFSRYVESVGVENLWSDAIADRIAAAYSFPPIRKVEEAVAQVDAEPIGYPTQGLVLPNIPQLVLEWNNETAWQLAANDPRAFPGSNPPLWLDDRVTQPGWPRSKAKPDFQIRIRDKACEEQMRAVLSGDGMQKPDLSILCDRTIRAADDAGLPSSGLQEGPDSARLIDITLPARNGQPEVVLRFWHNGTIYLYNVKGLPP